MALAETGENPLNNLQAADFWEMTPTQRQPILLDAIAEAHAWHYERNPAYQRLVESRGVGPQLDGRDLTQVLRPTAQTFKSYISVIGTPFPQERPDAFLEWLADHLLIPLPRERFQQFEPRNPTLEKLLQDFEAVFDDFGFEVTTSSGTSGRATIMVRDRQTVDLAVDCFVQATLAFMGVGSEHNAIFMLPSQTRTVAIVPVKNVMEVPRRYLQQVGRHHLQSMSVALGSPDTQGLEPRLLRYAEALGAVGVTSIRTVGRGAFPQLAYSWDGLLPSDLIAKRQRGHFTALEFDEPWLQIYETYGLIRQVMKTGTQEP
jgi:hypothetical protein